MSDNPTQTESGALEDRSGSHNTSEDEVKRLKADLNEIKELLHKVFLEMEPLFKVSFTGRNGG